MLKRDKRKLGGTPNPPKPPHEAQVQSLYALLLPGKERPKSSRQICKEMGLNPDKKDDRRKIGLLKEYSVDFGLIICSGQDGYWIYDKAGDDAEMEAYENAQIATMLQRRQQRHALIHAKLYQAPLL